MRMAKEQVLDLNPSRLLGACGKLKCCLRYEHELYCELLACLPKIGQWVQTPKGKGQVTDLNVLLMRVTVALEDGGYSVWHVSELSNFGDSACANGDQVTPSKNSEVQSETEI